MEVGGLGSCAYTTGWCRLTAEGVMSKAKEVIALGISIEVEVGGDILVICNEENATQAGSDREIVYYGENNSRLLLHLSMP